MFNPTSSVQGPDRNLAGETQSVEATKSQGRANVVRVANTDDLTFTGFTELLLARLHEAEKTEGEMVFINLRPLAAGLKADVSDGWVRQAATYLHNQGLIHQVQGIGGAEGAVQAMLTPEGRLFVEREEGTGLIRRYHENPTNYVVVSGSGNQIVVGNQGDVSQTMTNVQQTHVLQLFDRLTAEIEADDVLDEDEKAELQSDVSIARLQIEKRKPNLGAAVAILKPLGQLATFGSTVAELLKALGHD